MIPRDTRPIPFHKLLKVVVIIDRNDEQTKELLDHIEAENFEVEICDDFERDGFNYEVQGVFQEKVDGRIKFHTYVVRE